MGNREPPLGARAGLWLQLMDWDGRSWQGRSLGGEDGELPLEVSGLG